jgi:hypothetical protein
MQAQALKLESYAGFPRVGGVGGEVVTALSLSEHRWRPATRPSLVELGPLSSPVIRRVR